MEHRLVRFLREKCVNRYFYMDTSHWNKGPIWSKMLHVNTPLGGFLSHLFEKKKNLVHSKREKWILPIVNLNGVYVHTHSEGSLEFCIVACMTHIDLLGSWLFFSKKTRREGSKTKHLKIYFSWQKGTKHEGAHVTIGSFYLVFTKLCVCVNTAVFALHF